MVRQGQKWSAKDGKEESASARPPVLQSDIHRLCGFRPATVRLPALRSVVVGDLHLVYEGGGL